jgi:predicted Rossmann fold nucleotide-binding protein DprA/Smf involved in DNA uptake
MRTPTPTPHHPDRARSLPSVIETTLESCKAHLAELDRQIKPLRTERDQLRQAIEKLQALTPAPSATNGTAPTSARRPARRSSRPRAPKGQNRRLILAAIRHDPKTASQITTETGIPRPIAATTLTKLVKDGLAVKADRGYQAANTLLWRNRH